MDPVAISLLSDAIVYGVLLAVLALAVVRLHL
jgi:hypothetical protein